MIARIFNATASYLPPILGLTAILLTFLVTLAPTGVLHTEVALLTIFPSTQLASPLNQTTTKVDGPSIWLGLLGSCARPNNGAPVNCTSTSLKSSFDLSTLPKSAPTFMIDAPSPLIPVFVSFALALDTFFLLVFVTLVISSRRGAVRESQWDGDNKSGGRWRRFIRNVCIGTGFSGFIVGLMSFLILRMWYGKTVEDFNGSIQQQSAQAPELIAAVGNAFTMIWVAHGFLGVPVVLSLKYIIVKSRSPSD